MQIQLKQSEIIIALKQYIVQQGISLGGKSVSVAFTAGRRESGISADISIDEDTLPDLEPDDETPAAPVLYAVPPAMPPMASAPEEAPATPVTEEPEPETVAPKATPSVSLFGN